MLESKAVTKAFGSKIAVNHVDLKLEAGHIYALLGPNGSGKTTWMKMAAGLIKPTGGEVWFDGKPVDIDSRRYVAYMSTEPYFYSWMSAKDVGKYYGDFFEDFSYERYVKLLSSMELSENLKTRALSSGMMA
ncbi:MAG: ATP-binding cassette domain-containing protein [Clostridia bacterium]|nr:ATP-binding cassette domain-containing protein [Clostridia bacterium]